MTDTPSHSAPRPISPHLTIYRWKVTMLGSILHRVSGVALYAGTFLLVLWLWSAAYYAPGYQRIYLFMHAWYGQVMLLGWMLAFYYHLCNGIRHLWWDIGQGFEIKDATRTGWLVLIGSIILTAITWWMALQRGV